MAVEGEKEKRSLEMQARAEKKRVGYNKYHKERALRHSARLTKIISKIEVGRWQREMEVLKSRTAEKVQRLRTAGNGKWAAEGDKVWSRLKLTYTITTSTNIHFYFYFEGTPMNIDMEADQLSVAMQGMAMEVVEGQVEVTTADTSKGIGEEVKVGINIICFYIRINN
jgi:hypothetical protein